MPPRLDDHERAVVERAHKHVAAFLDDLRPWLLERAGDVGTEVKGDGSPVTDADMDVDERFGALVGEAFPDHDVLSEERDTRHHGADWTWVVDPIDGTSNFTAGLPYWCVSIALTLRGWPVLAIVDAPPLATRFEAVLGEGATRDGHPIHVRAPVGLDDAHNRHVPLFLTTGTARRLRPRVRLNPRVMGAAALDLCLVAAGVGAAAIGMKPKVWDHAAGRLIVEEAGGAYVTFEGEPLLPLQPDTEYAGRSARAAVGPTEEYLHDLVGRLVDETRLRARH